MLRRAESIPDRHSFGLTPVGLHHETSRFPIGYDEAVQGDTDNASPTPNAPFVPGNEDCNLFVRFSTPKTAIQNKPLLSFRRKTNA
jgi:hypothetical protein